MTISNDPSRVSDGPKFPAENDEEWHALMQNGEGIEFIRSEDDWHRLLKETRGTDSDPLPDCDDETVDLITRGLVFYDGGLAGADYAPIADKLTFRQFRALFERFGLGLGLFADHDGYRCESRGTCTKLNDKICTSNC